MKKKALIALTPAARHPLRTMFAFSTISTSRSFFFPSVIPAKHPAVPPPIISTSVSIILFSNLHVPPCKI